MERDEEPIELGRLLGVLRRNIWLIAFATAALTLVVGGLSLLSSEQYRTTARIAQNYLPSLASGSDETQQRQLSTSRALIDTAEVLQAAARRVPGESEDSLRDVVSAELDPDTNLIAVTATSDSADKAARIANAVSSAFLDRRAAAERERIGAARRRLESELTGLNDNPASVAQGTAIRDRLTDLATDEATAGTDMSLIDPAQPPDQAYAPRPLRNALLALIAGLLISLLGVLARDRLRPRLTGARELARVADLRVLAELWSVGARRGRGVEREAPRALLGAVMLDQPPTERRTLVITSPAGGAGAGLVAARLATALARAGFPTLLVDGDPHSDVLERALGIPGAPGLAEALAADRDGDVEAGARYLQRSEERLNLLTTGLAPLDMADLAAPGALESTLVNSSGNAHTYELLLAPPLASGPEAAALARLADQLLLVCELATLTADQLVAARERIEALDVPSAGIIAVHGVARVDQRAAPQRPVADDSDEEIGASERLTRN